ncbi:MAG: MotA/TolQ/ExbB proton channel family protein [Verrucomicrobiales bacterium]
MEASPYTPPNSELATDTTAPKHRRRWIAGIGVALFTGPIWGMLGTIVGMIRAFNTLAENEAASAEALSQDISIALVTTMIGILLGLVGAILILTSFFATANREKWFFWWSVGLSAFWCLAIFPYGLIVGLPIAILFISKRAEFLKPTKA